MARPGDAGQPLPRSVTHHQRIPDEDRDREPGPRRESAAREGPAPDLHGGWLTVGRATYEPGWKWSEHIGAVTGDAWCEVEHIVLVLQGRMMLAMRDGERVAIGPGDLCHIPPGHDSWVVGDETYVSLHFAGTDEYARKASQPDGR